MSRISLIAALLLAGCASRPPLEKPTIRSVPPQLIAETGASLYLIEGPEDWLDDGSHIVLNIESPRNTAWICESGLKFALRHALSRKELTFKAQGDFLITSGHPTEATLTDPESIDAPPSIGFQVKLNASTGKSPGYVDLQWQARILTTDIRGTGTDETIAEGKGEAPLRATLVMRRHKAKDRYYFLMLRIASLEEP